jgi:hypothetical protein
MRAVVLRELFEQLKILHQPRATRTNDDGIAARRSHDFRFLWHELVSVLPD